MNKLDRLMHIKVITRRDEKGPINSIYPTPGHTERCRVDSLVTVHSGMFLGIQAPVMSVIALLQ